ncbi:MAG: hypothetical protein JSV04_06390, partial [Candidatus Heimdallarchaeota archaeon]
MFSSRYVLIIVILSLFTLKIDSVEAAETAYWGDIVNVRYSLYLDAAHQEPVSGNIDQTINYIYLGTGMNVPPELLELYPEAKAGYLEGFKAGIVGMGVQKTKEVKINA